MQSDSGIGFEQKNNEHGQNQLGDMADLYRSIICHVGEDPSRQGLLKTPERAAKAILFFTKGYEDNFDGQLILSP